MKHIQKFESYSTPNTKVTKVNEEFDMNILSQVPEMFNQFVAWLNTSHYDGTHELVANWEVVSGVLGAIGLVGGTFISTYLKFNKEQKAAVNQKIADKIAENPDADVKVIAQQIISQDNTVASIMKPNADNFRPGHSSLDRDN
jgi:putative heme iron utilization protein